VIAHIDMDSFFASVEQAVNPSLYGKPVIVGGRPDRKRTVVCSASYEAKKFGIESGMASQVAYRLCPQAIFVPANTAKYLYTSKEISRLLECYSDRVEEASVDEFYLDLTGVNVNDALKLSRDIKEKIKRRFNITGSIGIGPNRMVSKLASKLSKPDGLLAVSRENIPILFENLPIQKIAGIGPRITAKLNGLGVYTCGQLSKFPRELLTSYFGVYGLWLYSVSRGEDSSFVSAGNADIQKSIGHSITVSRDLYTRDDVSAYILMLSEMVGKRLRRDNLMARVVRITIRYRDLEMFSKQKTLPNPISSTSDIYGNVLLILGTIKLNSPVRLLGVSLSGLIENLNQSLIFEADKRPIYLNRAIDSINERFGDFTLTYAKTLTIP